MINCADILRTFAVGALLGVGGCAMQAHSDHDPRFAVASCHGYAFSDQQSGAAPTAAAFDNPVNGKRLREAIADSLAARHVPPAADSANADCLVSYAIGSRLAADSLAPQYFWGIGPPPPFGWGPYAAGGLAWGPAPYAYRQGRVTVDLYDARSHQALWHAYVDADVTELTGAEADAHIRAAVAAIFRQFPPVAAATAGPSANKS